MDAEIGAIETPEICKGSSLLSVASEEALNLAQRSFSN
jgi:hypothetical protein